MNTIYRVINRQVVSEQSARRITFASLTSASLLVMILGIRRLAELELTEAQVFLGATATMTLAGLFIVLALLIFPPFRKSLQ